MRLGRDGAGLCEGPELSGKRGHVRPFRRRDTFPALKAVETNRLNAYYSPRMLWRLCRLCIISRRASSEFEAVGVSSSAASFISDILHRGP